MYQFSDNNSDAPLDLSVHNPIPTKLCARHLRQFFDVVDLSLTSLWQGSGTKLVLWGDPKNVRRASPHTLRKKKALHIPLPFPITIAACYDFRRVAMPGECLDLTDENLNGLKELYAEENADLAPQTLRQFLCTR